MKKLCSLAAFFAAALLAAAPADFKTWLPVDGNLHRDKAKYIQIVEGGADFNGAQSGIYSFSTAAIPAKNGQVFTVTATISGSGKGKIGFITYSNMAYAHCDGDAGVDFVATEQPKQRKFKIRINSSAVQSIRPTMVAFGGATLKLRDVDVSVEDLKNLPADFSTWLPVDSNLHRDKAKYIKVVDDGADFSGVTGSIYSFSTTPLPAKDGQIYTVTATVSGKGKGRIGFLTYADMNYTRCDGDGSLDFVATEQPKQRTFKIRICSSGVKSIRPSLIAFSGATLKLRDVMIGVEDAAVQASGTTEVPLNKWLINAAAYQKTPAKYLTFKDDSTLFSGVGTDGIDYFNPDPIPVRDGQVVTIKMVFNGKGKAWVGPIAYKSMAYAQYPEATQDISFILNGKKMTRTFSFTMKGKELKAIRPKFILTRGTTLELFSMTVTVSDKPGHPPLNPLLPEASFFPGPMSIARWIWSPCDIRFSYYRKVKMQDAFFRQKFTVDKPVKSVELMAGFRLPGKVFVNGKEIPETPFVQPPYALRGQKYVLTDAVQQGGNQLAVEIVNKTEDKSCGLIYLGTIKYADGSVGYFASSGANVKAVKDMPSGDWKAAAYDDSKWTQAMEMGDASTGRWIQMGDTIALFTTPEENKNYYDTLEKAKQISPELTQKINAEPAPDASIIWENGLPMIRINANEKIMPFRRIGLATVAPYDGYDFIAKTRDFGLDLYDIGCSDYHSGKMNYWKAEGKYDFSGIDLQAAKMLSLNPRAHFIISFGTNVMRQWCLDHPDEVIGYGMGPVNPAASEGDELGGRPLRPSPASRLFRVELERIYKALAEYISTKPWAKRVIAIKHSYGVTAEWEYYGSTHQMPDCGVVMTRAFREFLRARYKDDAALQKAWGKADASIDKAVAPTPEERWGDKHYLRDPKKFRNVLDFYDCMHKEIADLMIFSAKTSKKYFPGRLFGVYYSYQNMPRSPEGAKTMEEYILSSGAVDFFCAPNDYNNETRSGGGTGMTRVRTSIMQRFGKLGILEADIRTHICENGEEVLNLKSPEETTAVIRRDFCNTIFDREGLQLHQFGGTGPYRGGPDWYNDPGILAEIKKNLEIQREVRKISGMQWEQNIAVVSSYDEFAHQGHPEQDLLMHDYTVWWQIYALYKSGYGFDYMDMKDYMLSKHRYKAVVFLSPYTFTAAQRKALRAKLKNTGTAAVWIYAPGLVTENGFSDAAMEELTGIRLKADFRKLPMWISLSKDDAIWLHDPWHNNAIVQDSPRISSVDPKAQVKGKYSDGSAGFVSKKVDGFRSVFIGVPVRQATHWAQLFKSLGLKSIAQVQTVVRANSHLLMIHVGEGGVYEINVPVKTRQVTDMFTKKVMPVKNGKIELVCDAPTTWLFRMK